MTAVIYHGPPGSYKTFSVTQDVIVPALLKGRVVVTNIRGLTSLETIEDALKIDLPDTAEILALPHTREGFHDIARFFHWAPKGALIVMDEGQRVYPTRLRSLATFDYPGGKEAAESDVRPATLEDAFDQHRHHNWDIYITTTHIDKIHREIRTICEYGYRHRDVTGFVPWWRNHWKETKHDPANNGTAPSHAVGQPRVRKADKRIFKCYQSTATGIAKKSAEGKNVFKNPNCLPSSVSQSSRPFSAVARYPKSSQEEIQQKPNKSKKHLKWLRRKIITVTVGFIIVLILSRLTKTLILFAA